MKTKMLLFAAVAVVFAAACFAGVVDLEAGVGLAVVGNVSPDLRALELAMKQAFDKLCAKVNKVEEDYGQIRLEVLDFFQRNTRVPQGGAGDGARGELTRLVSGNDGLKAFLSGQTPMCSIEVPAQLLFRNAITNPNPLTNDNPLVAPDRGPGYIIHAPQQRLTIRSLFRQLPTSSNLIERATESTFTNNARPQGDVSPVGHGEGELKAESAMTFTLVNVPIVTIAHHIVASRQILGDAPLLEAHLEGRLLYGLNLEEEQELLTGTGAAGEINGINNNAAAFTGGATNATRLDTLARGADQLANANYEPSAFVLSPTDWLNCQLEKDNQGRYVLGDPGAARMPMLWGLPVVPTASQTSGRFTVLDAMRYGYVADRELATVRISENVNDQFIRNLVTLLCEKRTTLVTELGGAAVYGSLTYLG